jgi:propionate CoA-transferase
VWIPGELVDAVVVYPKTEQAPSVQHRKYWPMFTLKSNVSIEEGIARVRYINKLIGVTPQRSAVDNVLARLGASLFVEKFRKGDIVDVGVGLPEEVSRLLYESGALKDITLITESGVLGGLAAPGIFFGAAVNPTEIISSAEVFKRMYEHLDGAVLGILQTDSAGNVNVSKRGKGAINYVGPGGFIDITACAKTIFFVGSWGDRADFQIEGNKLRMANPGKVKFVEKVDEITFSGPQALMHGKKVYYVTHVGAFQLTERGMELIQVMPGIDIQKDILESCSMKVLLPESGKVPVVDASIVTGQGFKLAFKN